MSVTFDNSTIRSAGGVTSPTFSYTCTGTNGLLVVCPYNAAGDNVTGVTYNGVSMTQVQKKVFGSSFLYMYILLSPATGSNTLTISASAGDTRAVVSSYATVNQSGQPDNSTTSAQSAVTTYSASITPVASGVLVVGAILNNSGDGSTAVSGTLRQHDSAGQGLIDILSSTGATTLSYSGAGSANTAGVIASFTTSTQTLTMPATQGAYTYTGFAALFTRTYTMLATVGSYLVTGFAVLFTPPKWTDQTKNTSSQTNQSKSSTSVWTDGTKNSSSMTNQTKN